MKIINEDEMRRRLTEILYHGRVVVGGNFATPGRLLELYNDTEHDGRFIHVLNAQKGYDWPTYDNSYDVLETCFVGPGFRKQENLKYIPARLSCIPGLFRDKYLPVDAVFLNVADAAYGNMVSLGIECNILPAAIEAAHAKGGKVFAMLNRCMPYTFGESQISVDDIDYAIYHDENIISPPERPVDDLSKKIAKHIAPLIPDDPVLQLGIGSVPDAVLGGLTKRNDIEIFSEMISDGVMKLDRAGCIKEQGITTSFLFGSPEFYTWVSRNPNVYMARTETVNDPAKIATHKNMVSINSALQVDLFGECNASRVKGQVFSGFGGQTDFIVGALHAPGGQAFIALPSWHPKANVSTIVPTLDAGVTSMQPSHIVTEHGVASLRGASQDAQADRLIRIAHPDARSDLYRAATGLLSLQPVAA